MDLNYYTNLTNNNTDLVSLLKSPNLFSKAPNTWHVIVVDVQNSTGAVSNGNHHQVNLTATGAIISVLNTIRKEKLNITIPYFFGGDGATFIIPNLLLNKLLSILNNYRIHIKESTSLTLRVGSVSIDELANKGHKINIAKQKLTPQLTIPIILGDGLKIAEKIIKQKFVEPSPKKLKEELINLEGMECRWKEITPPKTSKKIVCLLIDCIVTEEQQTVYASILSKMNTLFGDFTERQPISPSKMKLDYSVYKIWKEMKVRLVKKDISFICKNWLITLLGKYYFNFSKEGKQYLNQISQLSHTFMLDGSINTIFTATESKINLFIEYLNQLEKEKKIIYGIHITHSSIMSCYVIDRKTKHAHFIDGTEGGYTSAAKMLKQKLK